jgi:helix-turn-helix protein
MATGHDVLMHLIPEGGWTITGDSFEGIEFINCEPISKKQFTDGFGAYDAWKIQDLEAKATARQAVLNRLGLTEEEAQLIIGGSN